MRLALLAAFPLHVLPGLKEHRAPGHYATWLPQLAEAFAGEPGLEAHWLVATRQRISPEPISWQGQTFHPLYVPGKFRMLRGYWGERAAMRRRLQQLAPDLVHAWGTEESYGLAGAACGRPWLLSMQGILQEYVRRVRSPMLRRVQAWYEKRVLAKARQISVESRWGREVLQRLAPRAELHLVEYGVQPFFFRQRWEPDRQRPRVVYIGTDERRKGLADAVEAFRDPRLRSAELEIIGDLGEGFQGKAPSNVRWLGRLSQEEAAGHLRRAWCLVLPTRADTSPNVVKEARVIGLPVVTTPHGGQSDYIREGVNGFLREPGDVAGFSEALATLCGSLETTRAMGDALWLEQREYFRPQHTAQRFLELYRRLAPAIA